MRYHIVGEADERWIERQAVALQNATPLRSLGHRDHCVAEMSRQFVYLLPHELDQPRLVALIGNCSKQPARASARVEDPRTRSCVKEPCGERRQPRRGVKFGIEPVSEKESLDLFEQMPSSGTVELLDTALKLGLELHLCVIARDDEIGTQLVVTSRRANFLVDEETQDALHFLVADCATAQLIGQVPELCGWTIPRVNLLVGTQPGDNLQRVVHRLSLLVMPNGFGEATDIALLEVFGSFLPVPHQGDWGVVAGGRGDEVGDLLRGPAAYG